MTDLLNAPGTFCWMDHQSRDRDGAEAFYAAVLGWNITRMPMGESFEYTMLDLAGNPVGGMFQMGDDTPPGVPTRWQMHIAVDDLDATVTHAVDLGAGVLLGSHDVADLGRLAVVIDPSGVPIGFWQAGAFAGFGVVAATGSLTWCEVRTRDVDAARDFYCALLGWTAEEIGGPDQRYVVLHRDGEPIAGAGPDEGTDAAPVGWVPYLAVADVDASVAQAMAAGATLGFGPHDTPYGRLAALVDPSGAPVNLICPNRDAVEAPPA